MVNKIQEASDLLDDLITKNRDISRKWGDALILATILLELRELNSHLRELNTKPKAGRPKKS